MINTNGNANWQMKSLEIRFMDYGEFQGKYVGKISFSNKQNESFVFNIPPDAMQPYIDLIAANVIGSANDLGKKLMQSLNTLELPANQS